MTPARPGCRRLGESGEWCFIISISLCYNKSADSFHCIPLLSQRHYHYPVKGMRMYLSIASKMITILPVTVSYCNFLSTIQLCLKSQIIFIEIVLSLSVKLIVAHADGCNVLSMFLLSLAKVCPGRSNLYIDIVNYIYCYKC